MLQHEFNAALETKRKAELYGQIIARFIEQGAQKGAIYGGGIGLFIWIIGALFGAPIGALAGIVLGLIDGLVIGYFVVYQDIPFATEGATAATLLSSGIVIIGAILLGVFTPGSIDLMSFIITIFLAIVAGFATWQGSLNIANWYEQELAR